MPDKEMPPLLIQTKLNRPSLPVDMVYRPRLTNWLKRHQRRPLTLISAPAGYGKSTLISCWLSSVDCPTAWVSLDEHDNQLGNFLGYFLGAIQTIFPHTLPETLALLSVTPQPSITAIAHTLVNELNQIEKPFFLVLDDYHLIESQAIHDLLSELLAYLPDNLHLVLSTRMDPPLPLITLRAKNQMTEIRSQDLRFTQEETQQLFREMLGVSVGPSDIDKMNAQAEGWVTGLRLAALAWHHRIGVNAIQGELSARNRYVSDYLFNEILERQAVTLSNCLLKTSILNRFCADLCEALCFSEKQLAAGSTSEADFSGVRFLAWLQASNLFVIPLDDQREWFRYHHLFQDFLQQQLSQRFDPDEIVTFHMTAGHWYVQAGWFEEGLHHFLAAGDTTAAIELIAQHRYRMMNDNQWPRLDRWLASFAIEIIEASPELWMLKTWLIYQHGHFTELPAALEHLDPLLVEISNPEMAQRLVGEISSLRGLMAYYRGDAEGAISYSRQALDLIPDELWVVRSFARIHLGGGLLLKGNVQESYQAFYSAFDEEKEQSKPFKGFVLMGACFYHWLMADLQGLEQAAKQAIDLCQAVDFPTILGQNRYHLGCVRYHHSDLATAEALFGWVVARPYQHHGDFYVNSVCGLALVYQAQGKQDQACQVVETAIAFLLETGNMSQMPLILALQAELALRQGYLSAASQWAAQFEMVPPLVPMPWFLTPHLTLVKVWLAQNTITSQAKAAELLDQLQEYLTNIHNTRFLIDILALQALLADAMGNRARALGALEKSLRLAQPGGFVRVFVDLGSKMAILLSRMRPDEHLSTYIELILAAFPVQQLIGAQSAKRPSAIYNLVEPLTNRELQILQLLGEHLTNKEIAAQLVISPGTVKSHTIRIYQKLDVKGRHQAVEKALTLGILASR